jgi:hypothetical protein
VALGALLLAKLRRTKAVSSGRSWDDLPHRLQVSQFCVAACRETKLAGLCLLLPMEQQDLKVLLAQGCQLCWSFRVKVAGCMVVGSMNSEFLYARN